MRRKFHDLYEAHRSPVRVAANVVDPVRRHSPPFLIHEIMHQNLLQFAGGAQFAPIILKSSVLIEVI
jgi:hypothetical protein